MQTATYDSVLDRIAGYLGQADGLDVETEQLARVKVNLFVRLAWQAFFWPDITPIEKRRFRPVYASATAYDEEAQVYFPPADKYYQALQATTGNAPATLVGGEYEDNSEFWAECQAGYGADVWEDGKVFALGDQTLHPETLEPYQCFDAHTASGTFDDTKFGLLTPFVRSLEYAQAGATAIGTVRYVWDRNPETDRRAQRITFRLTPGYVRVNGCVNTFWLEYRLRVPSFNGATRDDDATYAAGVTVYDTDTGDFWTSNTSIAAGESPTTDEDKWDKVEFPAVFAEYVAQSVYAALTNKEQEQPENITVQQSAGWPLLLQEMKVIEQQQGQTRQLNVVGR
jgi:hypothetical protein